MPYKLRKAPNRDLYWVVNKETGEKYSHEPIPKERAQAQMRALYASERTGGAMTRRQMVLKEYDLEDKSYSLEELSHISRVPLEILQEVYNRGIGAYKTNPSSVRLKGSFVKNVNAPMSRKLSPQQWAMARVYSFLDGNPKHDNDLRANKGGATQSKFEGQLESVGLSAKKYLATARANARREGYDPSALHFSDDNVHKLVMVTPEGHYRRFGRVGYNDFLIWSHLERKKQVEKGTAQQKQDRFWKSHTKIKGEWRNDEYSPNMLALKVLW